MPILDRVVCVASLPIEATHHRQGHGRATAMGYLAGWKSRMTVKESCRWRLSFVFGAVAHHAHALGENRICV